ncbi:hypothetical protein CDD82_7452 [Ophiocordyceps australis]|uniref:Vacuolar iron transporter Ccc1 n=1 Tax=Ophiocordyceps australis TaxID=1399860 RepID=A0A2C5ZJ10_9HYPO|nr:hypothetical protein CDD82_7452 [Ophiocordyceps australis]
MSETAPLLSQPPRPSISDSLRDVIIGFSDGLTVPFALTAGLSSLNSSRLVIMAGLAELFSGMISMGLGAYLAAATERASQRSRKPVPQTNLVSAITARYPSMSPSIAQLFVDEIVAASTSPSYGSSSVMQTCAPTTLDSPSTHDDAWLRAKLDLDAQSHPQASLHPCVSGLTMGLSYFFGGLIPMIPYFILNTVRDALLVSVLVTVAILLAFGYAKNYVAIRSHGAGFEGALQTLIIGVLAAGTSYGIVKLLDAGAS